MSRSVIGWVFINESYARLRRESDHHPVGEFLRFKNGYYFFFRDTFRHFQEREDGFYSTGTSLRFGRFDDVRECMNDVLTVVADGIPYEDRR